MNFLLLDVKKLTGHFREAAHLTGSKNDEKCTAKTKCGAGPDLGKRHCLVPVTVTRTNTPH